MKMGYQGGDTIGGLNGASGIAMPEWRPATKATFVPNPAGVAFTQPSPVAAVFRPAAQAAAVVRPAAQAAEPSFGTTVMQLLVLGVVAYAGYMYGVSKGR